MSKNLSNICVVYATSDEEYSCDENDYQGDDTIENTPYTELKYADEQSGDEDDEHDGQEGDEYGVDGYEVDDPQGGYQYDEPINGELVETDGRGAGENEDGFHDDESESVDRYDNVLEVDENGDGDKDLNPDDVAWLEWTQANPGALARNLAIEQGTTQESSYHACLCSNRRGKTVCGSKDHRNINEAEGEFESNIRGNCCTKDYSHVDDDESSNDSNSDKSFSGSNAHTNIAEEGDDYEINSRGQQFCGTEDYDDNSGESFGGAKRRTNINEEGDAYESNSHGKSFCGTKGNSFVKNEDYQGRSRGKRFYGPKGFGADDDEDDDTDSNKHVKSCRNKVHSDIDYKEGEYQIDNRGKPFCGTKDHGTRRGKPFCGTRDRSNERGNFGNNSFSADFGDGDKSGLFRGYKMSQVIMPSGKRMNVTIPVQPKTSSGKRSEGTKLIPLTSEGMIARREIEMVMKEIQETFWIRNENTHQLNGFDIIKIQKIVNARQWNTYKTEQKRIYEDLNFVNERMLFYASDSVGDVVQNGFTDDYLSEGAFGNAFYFFRNSSVADRFVFGFEDICPSHGQKSCYKCVRQLTLCRVTLGKEHRLAYPESFERSPEGYHSVAAVGGGGMKYPLFAVYNGAQVYPEYLITYKIRKPPMICKITRN